MTKKPYLSVIDDIKPLVKNYYCRWVSLGMGKIYNEIVEDVKVSVNARNQISLYFNNKSVDPNYTVDVQKNEPEPTYDIIGFPSGEVITLPKDKTKMLMDKGLVKFSEALKLSNGYRLEKVFFFNDFKYKDIKNALDPNFIEPESFKRGDVLICKGSLGDVSIEGKEAVVIADGNTSKGMAYYVEFIEPIIGKIPKENRYWILSDDILGKKEDVKKGKQTEINFKDLEEHEIDDDYHIKQLYIGKDNKMKYD